MERATSGRNGKKQGNKFENKEVEKYKTKGGAIKLDESKLA